MREGYESAIAATLALSLPSMMPAKHVSLSSSQFSETFLVTTRSLLTWLSATLFAVFGYLSADKIISLTTMI